jgi:flavin-dependent dehydrogenase
MVVASRRELDGWLLRRATAAGARHVAERVRAVEGDGRVRTASGEAVFDLVVGADGATSLVRRRLLGPLPPARVVMAGGWFARGSAPASVAFAPGLPGYLWLFPRPDHVGVGICGPLGGVPTRQLLDRLRRTVARDHPALADDEAKRYAHTIPSPDTRESSILEIAGPRWALVGDAAALADPITGEGIHHALRSAELLADTLRDDASATAYPGRVLEDLGRDLLKAAAIRGRFFSPGFPRRMVRYSIWSPAVRQVLTDLVLGEQGYLDLKRRLLRTGPRFLLDVAGARLGGGR